MRRMTRTTTGKDDISLSALSSKGHVALRRMYSSSGCRVVLDAANKRAWFVKTLSSSSSTNGFESVVSGKNEAASPFASAHRSLNTK